MSKPSDPPAPAEPATKRPAHRPPEMTGGRRVQVYLDAASIEAAARIGGGNVSEGIRLALRAASPPAP